jgi:hypothetical protein
MAKRKIDTFQADGYRARPTGLVFPIAEMEKRAAKAVQAVVLTVARKVDDHFDKVQVALEKQLGIDEE